MSGRGKDGMGFQHGNEGVINGEPSGMNTNPLSEKMTSGSTYFASGWDPAAPLTNNFGSSSMVSHKEFANSLYPPVMGNSSLVQYPSVSSYSELVPKVPCFGSGSFSAMVGPFGINECGPISNAEFPQNDAPNMRDGNERMPASVVQSQVVHDPQGVVGASPDGKKRKHEPGFDSPYKSKKQAEDGLRKDQHQESSEAAKEQNVNKLKTEQNNSPNSCSKNLGKQAADNSSSGEASKENYIHVRARRGQATNSHSLAERIRRERISERMRLLQELVPGCNKITGRAVMLDEIINYVQSLQQQVEFLSMKLATVNPELDIDIDRILSKDVYSRGANSTVHSVGLGVSSSHPYLLGNLHLGLEGNPNMIPQFTQLPQAVLDSELQNLLQMGFNPISASDNLGPNACLKPGL